MRLNGITVKRKKWEHDKIFYEQFVDRAEKEWYLSPFELQTITYFSETISAVNFALERLEDWYESAKEKDVSRVVMNHGSLSIHHFLYNDTGTDILQTSKELLSARRKTTCSAFLQKCSEAFRKLVRNASNGFMDTRNHFLYVKRKSVYFSAIWLIRKPCTRC